MPGAIIVADQPSGAGSGSPGEDRIDLWLGQQISFYPSTSGNNSYLWEVLSAPPGSAAALSASATQMVTFTPDRIGSYRVRLTTNGGGPGNVQTLIYRVRYSNTGTLRDRGWALPAIGERKNEALASSDDRGYAAQFEFIFADILDFFGDLVTNALVSDSNGVARYSVAELRDESTSTVTVVRSTSEAATVAPGDLEVVLVELDDPILEDVDVTVTVRSADLSVRGRWRLSGLFYRDGGAAIVEGTLAADADEKKSDVGLGAELDVDGNNVILRLTAIAGVLTWGIDLKRQVQHV